MDDSEDTHASKERLARQQVIGTELRDIFGRVGAEPIPDALLQLAAELDKKLESRNQPADLVSVQTDTDKSED